MKTFKVTKKIVIAFILMLVGGIMIISSFFISDGTAQCNAGITTTIFTSSFTIFAIGMLLLMVGLAVADVEYHSQTKWIINRHHKRKY